MKRHQPENHRRETCVSVFTCYLRDDPESRYFRTLQAFKASQWIVESLVQDSTGAQIYSGGIHLLTVLTMYCVYVFYLI